MFKKLFSIFAALTLSVGLWADGSVITYTATAKLEKQFQKFEGVVSHNFSDDRGIVTLSGTLTRIPYSAFNACKDLRSIELPESVTMIDEAAFNGCSLESITLPASVGTIGVNAFAYCSSLQSVTFLGNACQNTIGEDAFLEVGKTTPATLTLPANWTGGKPGVDGSWYGGKFTIPAPTPVSTSYINENGEEQNISAWEVKDASEAVTWGTAGDTTWFVVKGEDVQLSAGAICAGDVRLILADGAKLTATGIMNYASSIFTPGIEVSGEDNSLTIYAQSTNSTTMGQLIAQQNGARAAGIGGGNETSGSNITINGGKVTAQGGEWAAGIGGGNKAPGSNITINGGYVTATGGVSGAGIGGGHQANGSNITINGGKVTAAGTQDAAGIGGGYNGNGLYIYISDAYVLEAGADADNTEVIAHSSAQDLASTLFGKYYVKIEGLATPYTRTTSVDQWATVCLPYDATSFSGADFYKVNYYDGVDKLYIEPVDNLLAGVPYIFHTTATTVTIEHNATTPEEISAGNEYGLYGSFARKTIAYDAEHAFAALANNTVNVIEEGHTVTVPACRAYFDMDDVPDFEQPHSAPLRCIGVPSQTPTGNPSLHHSINSSFKTIENGQFRIVREGKTYNAQGIEL